MDALILAAGDGTRLSPLTKDKPKVMIKIYSIPILERSLHVLKNIGVERVAIIIGYKGEVIQKYFGNEWNGIKIFYRKTDWYGDGILKSAIKGKEAIHDRFIFLCGDIIPEEKSLKLALEKKGDMVIGLRNSRDDSIVAEVLENGRVKKIGMRKDMKKFNATVTGISVSDSVFFDAVENCVKNNKFDRSDAINWMIKKGYTVNSFDSSNDTFLDIDTFEDLEKAEKIIFENAVKERVKKPGIFKKLFNFPISIPLTKLMAGTDITPNQITIVSLSLFIIAGVLFSLKYFIIGGIVCYVSVILDAVDGKISRLKFKNSLLGKFFDSLSDRLGELSIIIGITLGIFFSVNNYHIFLLGLLCAFFIIGRFYLEGLYYELINEKINTSNKWKNSKLSKLIGLANRDFTLFVVLISCLFNQPIIGLSYMTFSASSAFFIRMFQTVKTLKLTVSARAE